MALVPLQFTKQTVFSTTFFEENPDSIEFEMEADVYTLRRTKKGVQLIISDQVAHPVTFFVAVYLKLEL